MNTYTVYRNGKPIASKITSSKAAQLAGIPVERLANYADRGYKFNGTYTFALDGEVDPDTYALRFTKEWDEARLIVNPKARVYEANKKI